VGTTSTTRINAMSTSSMTKMRRKALIGMTIVPLSLAAYGYGQVT